jgi:DNA topoisomerase I
MTKKLVIVESPGKIKKIGEILGKDYIVEASFGHCRDLDSKTLSIDVNNNYEPNYITIPDKVKVINKLKGIKKHVDEVILAADEDREGEMIASSLRDVLKLKNPKRIVFHEITKKAIIEAVENPTVINENMVLAQQTRRLLDRLVGYKISPLLWKQMQGQLSAGRVQSVVVKIIIDKENDIKNSISNPYFKSNCIFKNDKKKVNTVLTKNKEVYKFDKKEIVLEYLNKFDKKIKCIVNNVTFKEISRKPQPPFITSTLQQDASSRFGFNSKLTMSLAQKLYEAGAITYMRTDSVNLSKEAISGCKKYINENYGEKYYKYRTFNKKGKNAQEAHEAIRPTKIDVNEFVKLGYECQRLYSLIWKRTVASQMEDALIKIQTIYVDILRKDKSILPKECFYVTNFENILFDGFLVLYNNYETENESGIKEIEKNQELNFDSIKVTEEYTKPPLRYNESNLIKTLEKNGIGRPSTYASIMSKIIERNYVEIQNVDGVKKDSLQFTITKKSLKEEVKVIEETRKISIGKEVKKLVPTEIGYKVNTFLVNNFNPIMEIDFTVKLEKLLDKVANGKIKWYNVLDEYYQKFNPMVIKLQGELNHIKNLTNNDILVGKHPESNFEIYSSIGKYGLCVKILENDKWRYAPVKDIEQNEITLDIALSLLEYPKYIGKIGKDKVTINKGRYGFYYKKGTEKASIKDKSKMNDMEYAKLLFNNEDPYSLREFIINGKKIKLKKGPYGYYLQLLKDKKNKNIPIGQTIDEDKVNIEYIKKYL